jgi:hypothetical protein
MKVIDRNFRWLDGGPVKVNAFLGIFAGWVELTEVS